MHPGQICMHAPPVFAYVLWWHVCRHALVVQSALSPSPSWWTLSLKELHTESHTRHLHTFPQLLQYWTELILLFINRMLLLVAAGVLAVWRAKNKNRKPKALKAKSDFSLQSCLSTPSYLPFAQRPSSSFSVLAIWVTLPFLVCSCTVCLWIAAWASDGDTIVPHCSCLLLLSLGSSTSDRTHWEAEVGRHRCRVWSAACSWLTVMLSSYWLQVLK